MEQPTKEQLKKFWEWCGFKVVEQGVKNANGAWLRRYADGYQWTNNAWHREPKLDLNNIFKYAILKLQSEGYEINIDCPEHEGFIVKVFDIVHKDGAMVSSEYGDDLGLALFGAIWEVIK